MHAVPPPQKSITFLRALQKQRTFFKTQTCLPIFICWLLAGQMHTLFCLTQDIFLHVPLAKDFVLLACTYCESVRLKQNAFYACCPAITRMYYFFACASKTTLLTEPQPQDAGFFRSDKAAYQFVKRRVLEGTQASKLINNAVRTEKDKS